MPDGFVKSTNFKAHKSRAISRNCITSQWHGDEVQLGNWAFDEAVKKSPGLYIHIPFCRSKCPYCGFYSIPSASMTKRWIKAFKAEVSLYKGVFKRFDSLYLGGGTPTYLDPEDLGDIVQFLFRHLDFSSDSEITIEANPGDLTADKTGIIKDLGFNRVSLGVQSFDDRILSYLGRMHTAGDSEKALEDLRLCGFENIGLDLIYGFPEQSIKEWDSAINRALEFNPEHISCYQLTIEKGTAFERMKEKGTFKPMNENEEFKYFMKASNILEDKGYLHYEISNFARDECHISRHNSKYWHHVPYLGLGPSAHSFNGTSRWWNFSSVRKYCEALEAGRLPSEEYETLTAEQVRLESISLGLRNIRGFDRGITANEREANEILLMARNHGLVSFTGSRVIPTRKGFAVADRLAGQLCSSF
ncbi:MAG: radical SAM family heme chaperone HemW [Deltaproteobacteria bacterium]|nr:radical SAM family heme chaperone HemW [Deltaproteobacteria bacterium]